MSSHAVTVTVFLALTSGFLVLEAVARLTEVGVATLAETVRHVMRRRSGQVGLLLVWWWIGWHFFAG